MGTYLRCDDRLAAAQNGLMKAQSLRGWRLSLAFAIIAIAGLQPQAQWPRIAPLDTLFRVQDATHPDVKTFIKSPTGKPIYLLICRQSDDHAAPRDVNYSGDLDCHLMSAELGEVEENLLLEDHRLSAWYSRGRMFAQHLRGACAAYPEYGLLRHFRLRAMQISMEFKGAVFSPSGKLRSYQMRFTVVPDSTARRDIAEISGYLDPDRRVPGRSCAKVTRGDEWRN